MNKEYDPRQVEKERDILIAGKDLKEKILASRGIFSEKIRLGPRLESERTNLLTIQTDRMVRSFLLHLVERRFYNQDIVEGLFEVALNVNRKFPELIFSFQKDEEGQWVRYFVQDETMLSRMKVDF